MHEIAKVSLIVVGIVMALGGVMGFVKGKSKPSLIAGLISGAIFIGLYFLVDSQAQAAFIGGAALSVALAVMFMTRLRKTKKFMPSGMLLAISLSEFATLLLCYLFG